MAAVTIKINGEEREFPAGLSLVELLQSLGLEPSRVAVELNREIVRREAWAGTRIRAGARLEIVQFVGGGSLLT
jgi:thiamine biosynthesis protein ThiS